MMVTARLLAVSCLCLSAAARAAPKLPADAPYCAPPGTRPLFLSPMGEPFRAAAGAAYPSAAWFAAADRDRDGQVDRGEFVADADRFFRTLDADRDGVLTPEEVIVYERDVAPEIALYSRRRELPAKRARGDGSGYGGPMGAGRFAWLNVPEPVSATDADMNRLIDAREFAAAAGRRFDALDAVQTGARGSLRPAALPRTPQQVAIEGPCRPAPRRRPDDRRDEDAREGERPAGGATR